MRRAAAGDAAAPPPAAANQRRDFYHQSTYQQATHIKGIEFHALGCPVEIQEELFITNHR